MMKLKLHTPCSTGKRNSSAIISNFAVFVYPTSIARLRKHAYSRYNYLKKT